MRIGLGPLPLAGASGSQLAAMARAAVAASFDSVWVAESRGEGVGGGLAAAAMLAQVVPIRVGAVLDLGAYHPLYMAEDIAIADITSQGRIEVLLRGGSVEQVQLLVAALSGAHLQFRGPTLRVPAHLEANQPAPERLALNPAPAQPAVPIWVEGALSGHSQDLGVGTAAQWAGGVAAPAPTGRWPGLLLCPGDSQADELLRSAGAEPAYFLVSAVTPEDVVSIGRRLVGPLRMPEFPDWIGAQ